MTTPAGWYPDSSGQQRYWDGNAWTEHVQPPTGEVPPAAGAPQVAQPTPVQPIPAAAPAAAAGMGGEYGGYQRWAPTAYLEGAGSDFQGAIRPAFDNIFHWSGRASRSSYWWFVLAEFIIYLVAYVLVLAIKAPVLLYALNLVLVLVGLALAIRRLHDTDRSGWWYLIGLVPCVGWIVLLVFLVLPGTQGPNQYNLDPTGGPQAR